VESENVEFLVGEFFCCFRFRNNAQSNLSFTRLKTQEIDNNEEYKFLSLNFRIRTFQPVSYFDCQSGPTHSFAGLL
jgi:hypothetical protein